MSKLSGVHDITQENFNLARSIMGNFSTTKYHVKLQEINTETKTL